MTQPVSIILGERFLITLRCGRTEFIDEARRHCHQDFVRFARTPSVLLYARSSETWISAKIRPGISRGLLQGIAAE